MAYNPFDVRIEELMGTDLQALLVNQVAEGYWVEYKSAFQSNSKIAKSISSFANTYGGWYFIGIEADQTQNIPTKILGFSLDDTHDPISTLRELIKSNIDPTPVFYSKLVLLDNNRGVLVVNIPSNQETPFITRDGRIYRRISDSSDPIFEDNRFALDRLVDGGKQIARKFREFAIDERTFSEAENGGWVNIFISPYPTHARHKEMTKGFDETIEELVELSKSPVAIPLLDGSKYGTGNVPFTTARTTSNSVILTQNTVTDPITNRLGVEVFFDGKIKLHIPLLYLPIWTSISQLQDIKSAQSQRAISQIWEGEDVYLLKFFDMERLWSAVAVLLSYYDHWLNKTYILEYGEASNFKILVEANEIWRNVAFLDTDKWGEFVLKYGLPVINKSSFSYPRKYSEDMVLDRNELPLWMWINWILCVEFGFSEGLVGSVVEDALAKANKSIITDLD